MHKFEYVISALDHALNTKRRKHIAGGILWSASILFGGLAMTILTLKTEETHEQPYIE